MSKMVSLLTDTNDFATVVRAKTAHELPRTVVISYNTNNDNFTFLHNFCSRQVVHLGRY